MFGPNPFLDIFFNNIGYFRRRAAAKLDLMDQVDVTLDDLSPWVARVARSGFFNGALFLMSE